jgi:hypothetical protein
VVAINSKAQIIRDGAVAGVLGAATVAAWFLLFDFSRGSPFETPAVLAAVLFHGGSAQGHILPLAAEYTVVHLSAFIVFGVGAAILLEAAERNRSLFASLLIMLAVFEGLFVALVMLLGPQLQGAVSWWSVLVGNLLATAVMVGYFFARHPRLGDQLFGPWMGVLAEGAAAGVIGGAVVVLWFLLHDLGSGSNPFRTPALLGGVILEGVRKPAAVAVSPLVMGYTVLHFAVFIAFGVVAACLAASQDEPLLWAGFLLLFCGFQVFFVGFASLLSGALLEQLGWVAIVAGNLLSAAAMLGFFYLRRRALHLRLLRSSKANFLESGSQAL